MRMVLAGGTVTALALMPAMGTADSRRSHDITERVRGANIAAENGFPNEGGRIKQLGLLTISFVGEGRRSVRAVWANTATVTKRTSDTTYELKGRTVSYFCNGTIRTVYTGTLELRPDGSFKTASRGRVTGGSGALRGTRASYRVTGSGTATTGLVLNVQRHRVTYPRNVVPQSCTP